MNWGSLENFIAMGGYGPYVWGSYGVCVAVLVAEMIAVRLRRRRAEAEIRKLARAGKTS
jgi:heme exporter protein D